MTITRTGLSLAEFLALPEEKPALEYVDGVVVQKMAPQYEHSTVQAALVLQLAPQLALGQRGRVPTEAVPRFRTRRDLRPPEIEVSTRPRSGISPGYMFVAPKKVFAARERPCHQVSTGRPR